MPEAERLVAAHVASPPPPAAAAPFVQSRLLLGLEAILEPLITVLSLWLLVWRIECELTALWLIATVVAFALAFPGS
jgi:putative colanic acid biosynthesis UDP-glucose lipid carrier transferase